MVCAYLTIIAMMAAFDLPLLVAGTIFPQNNAYEDGPPVNKFYLLYSSDSWPIVAFCLGFLPIVSTIIPKNYLTQQFGVIAIGTIAAYCASLWWMPDSGFYVFGTAAGLIASTVFGRCSQGIWAEANSN